MIGAGTSFEGKILEEVESLDFKWFILLDFGTKYIKAQIYIILYDCSWKLVFRGESLGKSLDSNSCILVH